MQAEGTLELFAELSVAFAGFTGLAGVLTRSSEDAGGLRQEIRLLVEYSVINMMMAVLPLVLWGVGLSGTMAWRVACVVAALESAAYYAVRFTSVRASAPYTGGAWAFWLVVAGDGALALARLLAGAGLAPWVASSVYVVALSWNLVGMSLSFLRLIKPIWQDAGGDKGTNEAVQRSPVSAVVSRFAMNTLFGSSV